MANYGPLLHFNTAFNYYNWLPIDIMSWGPGKSNFWTRSTGPKPSQLVPKFIKCALESQIHLNLLIYFYLLFILFNAIRGHN